MADVEVNETSGFEIDISQIVQSVVETFRTMFTTWMQIYIQLYVMHMMVSIFREMFSMFRLPPVAGGGA